jgi:hypothetical protein
MEFLMHDIEDYKIVTHSTTSDLAALVKKLLDSGWELYGTPFVSNANWAQGMIKRKQRIEPEGRS